ncbi:DUF669 domain-containing protein [Patescibacteria group bacterium]|nr:DUF669 domain-containing protein [Patescibacteria group bacterium]
MSEEQVPFEVVDAVEVGDLSGVQQSLLPITQNVLVRVQKAGVDTSKDKALKSLRVELRIVNGIMVGEEIKYMNKPIFPGFMDLCIWADPAVKTSDWYQRKQHLLGFKQFCQALEIPLDSIKVNDEFCQGLIGKELLVNITHEEDSAVDANTGERVKTGTMRERIRGFKKAA